MVLVVAVILLTQAGGSAPGAGASPSPTPSSMPVAEAPAYSLVIYNRTSATIAFGPAPGLAPCSTQRFAPTDIPASPASLVPGSTTPWLTVTLPPGYTDVVSIVVTTGGARETLGEIDSAALPRCEGPTSPSPAVAASPTPLPSPIIACVPEAGPLPSGFDLNPCPSAIAAVRGAVAPLGLPVAQIHIQPGYFPCGQHWPGVGSPPVCFGPLTLPGTAMHGWVAFAGSEKVAAVQLTRRPPTGRGASPSGTGAWQASMVAFEVPPAGWLMP